MSASQIRNLLIVLTIVAVVAVSVVVWLAQSDHKEIVTPVVPEQTVAPEPTQLPEPVVTAPEPQIEPQPVEPEPVVISEPEPAPEPPAEPKIFDFELPALADSDATLLQVLNQKIVNQSVKLLVDEALIEHFVTTVDVLARGQVAYNQLPIARPVGQYKVIEAEGKLFGSTANIARYQPYLDLMTAMPREHWVALYQHTYPLLQEAYELLGYQDKQFHSVMLQAIERLLSSPKPGSSVELAQPHVMYEYADGSLQAMSSADKLMTRLGPNLNQKVRLLLAGIQQPLQQWQPE